MSVDVLRPTTNIDYLRAVVCVTQGYDYCGSTLNNQLITGTAPVPVAPYSASSPDRYAFLVFYAVPTPGILAMILTAAGPGLLVMLRRRRAPR